MISREALEIRVEKLKEKYKTRLGESQNPRADGELRALRKRLKRVQRKIILLKAAEQKEKKKDKGAQPVAQA